MGSGPDIVLSNFARASKSREALVMTSNEYPQIAQGEICCAWQNLFTV